MREIRGKRNSSFFFPTARSIEGQACFSTKVVPLRPFLSNGWQPLEKFHHAWSWLHWYWTFHELWIDKTIPIITLEIVERKEEIACKCCRTNSRTSFVFIHPCRWGKNNPEISTKIFWAGRKNNFKKYSLIDSDNFCPESC